MKHYFRLQFKLLNRHISDFGLQPNMAYLLTVLGFVGLSVFLFYKTDLAPYLYLFISSMGVFNLSKFDRNNFLKSCFSVADYRKVRLIENAVVTAPFFVFLMVKQCFLPAFSLMLMSGFLAMFNFRNQFNVALPTPFFRQPFEFIVGFRKLFLAFIFVYFLAFMGLWVGNFNLALVSLLFVFMVSLAFYAEPEGRFYVWVQACSPKVFLLQKIKIAWLHVSILTVPILVSLLVFYPENAGLILGFQGLGYIYLASIVAAKYSAYPGQVSLPQSFLIGIGFVFPPMLLLILPMFYTQSIKRLRHIL